jgi:DNA-binding CsgD family transcriptional regulator
MAERVALGRPVSFRRVDLVPDDEVWYGPHWQRYRRPMGLDEFLYGIVPIAGERGRGHLISGVGLHRATGQAGFTERDRHLLHIVVTEIPWLHRAGLPEAEAAGLEGPGPGGSGSEGSGLQGFGRSVSDLTPRLRTVFGLLMQGWKRPRIAEHLGISENTAKAHIREVYRYFGVGDHVELLRRFMSDGSPDS